VAIDDQTVSFRWKDYAHGSQPRVMTLEGSEFLRRFLMHVVPTGFMRIRYFGLLANRFRSANLARCRELLAATGLHVKTETPFPNTAQIVAHECCPRCKTGQMVRCEFVRPISVPPLRLDTS
jgi:Putative transposase